MAKKKWSLDHYRKYEKSWIENPGTRSTLYDKPRHDLESAFQTSSRNDLLVALSLGYLSTWEGHQGGHLILSGNETGWAHLNQSLYLRAWATCLRRVVAERQEQKERKRWEKDAPLLQLDEPNCFAQAIAYRSDRVATWIGDRVLAKLKATAGGEKPLYNTPVFPFVAMLYAKWKNADIVFRLDIPEPLGVYTPLLSAWDDENKFSEALVGACDYHCVQSFDNPNDPEFTNAPYGFSPMEILALRRVRNHLEKNFPSINHVLLNDNPFTRIPDVLEAIEDALVKRVVDRLKLDYPEIDCF